MVTWPVAVHACAHPLLRVQTSHPSKPPFGRRVSAKMLFLCPQWKCGFGRFPAVVILSIPSKNQLVMLCWLLAEIWHMDKTWQTRWKRKVGLEQNWMTFWTVQIRSKILKTFLNYWEDLASSGEYEDYDDLVGSSKVTFRVKAVIILRRSKRKTACRTVFISFKLRSCWSICLRLLAPFFFIFSDCSKSQDKVFLWHTPRNPRPWLPT